MEMSMRPPTGIHITWTTAAEQHVVDKHVNDPGADSNAAKFNPGVDWKSLAQDAVNHPDGSVIQGDGRYKYYKTYSQPIGHKGSGQRYRIRVVIKPDGSGSTTFPDQ
jgi:hypothetical protein